MLVFFKFLVSSKLAISETSSLHAEIIIQEKCTWNVWSLEIWFTINEHTHILHWNSPRSIINVNLTL